MRPAYLAGQRYDTYNGHGWATTVDDTFDEIGPDGKRYSSQMSFYSGQGVHLSPDVTHRPLPGRGGDDGHPAKRRSPVHARYLSRRRPAHQCAAFLAAAGERAVPTRCRRADRPPPGPATDRCARQQRKLHAAIRWRINSDSPLPLDPTLAAEIQAERDALLPRFLDVGWEIGPDGRAQALRVSGQLPVYDDVEAVFSQDNVAKVTPMRFPG